MALYTYSATIVRVIDGDSMDVLIDLGFKVFTRQIVRLHGINCPEMNTPEGKAAKEWVMQWVAGQTRCTIETVKDKREKYGRMLARVFGSAGELLNQTLVDRKFAVPYMVE